MAFENHVSILVLVDFALKLRFLPRLRACRNVSILVLVDFALKLLSSASLTRNALCFNPCFGGFCSETYSVG